jgi:hypothetical protein
MVTMRRGFAPIDAPEIARVERELAVRLPDRYRAFLLETNGGRPSPNVFVFQGPTGPQEDLVHWLFGIHFGELASLVGQVRRSRGRVPDTLIPIGEDPFGNLICLAVTGSAAGRVLFWDHEREASEGEPPATDNLYPIADSFDAFLGSLKS